MVALDTRYRLMRRIEAVQVLIAWILSYLWFLLGLFAAALVVLITMGSSVAIWWETRTFSFTEIVLPVLIVLLFNVPILHMFIRIRRYRLAAKTLEGAEKLPAQFDTLVRTRLDYLIRRMERRHENKLRRCELHLFVERENHKATPSMMAVSKKLNLILPLGFFKVFQSDPQAADAMLAHELAHFLHRDSGLLLGIRSYLKGAVVGFNYLGVVFVIVICVSCFRLVAVTADINRARRGIHLGESYRPDPSAYQTPWGYRNAQQQRIIEIARDRRLLAESSQKRIELLGTMVQSAFPVIYFALLFLYLRRRVRRSEEMADLFAITVSAPGAVGRFLNKYMGGEKYTIRSLHPSIARRLRYVEHYERLLAETSSE